jgi:hypothetical protein
MVKWVVVFSGLQGMNFQGKKFFSKRVIGYEVIFFAVVIAVIWLDELLDLPHWIVGAAITPVNWQEAIMESVMITIVASLVIAFTGNLFAKMKYLEGILPVCMTCKRIRDSRGAWQPIEEYIRDRSEADFSHGFCPDCADKFKRKTDPHSA